MDNLVILLKTLINYQNRMKILHWNVAGKHFDRVHNTTDDLYDMLTGMIDRCGEIIKVLGGTIPKLSECTLPDDDRFIQSDYSSKEAWDSIRLIVSTLISKYNNAISTPNLLEGIRSKLSDDQYTLIVEMYKIQQRLKKLDI